VRNNARVPLSFGSADGREIPMKSYKVPIFSRIFFITIMLLIAVLFFWIDGRDIVRKMLRGSPEGLFTIVWVSAYIWTMYRMIVMPLEVRVNDDLSLVFRSIVGSKVVLAADVKSIKRNGAFIQVKYNGGKLYLLQGMTGFYELLSTLKEANPSIVVKGY
jgi:hypothetical protein